MCEYTFKTNSILFSDADVPVKTKTNQPTLSLMTPKRTNKVRVAIVETRHYIKT